MNALYAAVSPATVRLIHSQQVCTPLPMIGIKERAHKSDGKQSECRQSATELNR